MFKVGDEIIVSRAETNSGIWVDCDIKGTIKHIKYKGAYSVEIEADGYWNDKPGAIIEVLEENINLRKTNLNILIDET